MAKKRAYINSTKLQKELFQRTEGYAENVRRIYNSTLSELIDLVKGTELEDGKPFSFEEYGCQAEANKLLRRLYSSVYKEIRGDSEKEWMLSNSHSDDLVKGIFGEKSIKEHQCARFFNRNREAMDAFLSRKSGSASLDLSQRVWKYGEQLKVELEDSLDLAIGEGIPANRLASKIQEYLREPDRFYRRFRVRAGEDADGNPLYGRIWKRRVFDKETETYKWIDEDPKKYKSGQGVYRSSYRNAQRLARTETNIAYRTADYERWQQLDFVVGIEIKLSNNHPHTDICDDLKGIYPKTFKWTGWHPNCRCYMVPVRATEKEIDEMVDKILAGDTGDTMNSSNEVDEYPSEFKQWVKDKEGKIDEAKTKGTLPYFVKDNPKDIGKILNPLTPEQKHHQDLVAKYGEGSVQKLYEAFDGFKTKISTGDLAHQVKKLSFEIGWIGKNGKYPTSPEMVNLLEKELATVQVKYDTQQAVQIAQPILGYKSKSKPLNAILDKLNGAITNGGTAKEIEVLTAQATAKIQEIEKSRLLKVVKGNSDGSTIDLYATAQEKLEIARLQSEYDKLMAKNGNQWDYEVNQSYQSLAKYKKELAQKYLSKQGTLVKLNGETPEMAKKALEEYLKSPVNTTANTPIGGRFQKSAKCDALDKQRIKEYSKLTGISEDELGLITRYTYGSKWCNQYGYGKLDPYFGKVQDYDGLCQKFYPAANSVLEKLPRFQGTTFSGVSLGQMELDKFIIEAKACLSSGQSYVNKAFLSSTTNIDRTTIFGDNVQLVINGKRGVDLKAITHHSYRMEDEVLFRAGSKFKITAVYQEATQKYGFGRGWVIEMTEI